MEERKEEFKKDSEYEKLLLISVGTGFEMTQVGFAGTYTSIMAFKQPSCDLKGSFISVS